MIICRLCIILQHHIDGVHFSGLTCRGPWSLQEGALMNLEVSRRHFMKLAGAGVAGSAVTAVGVGGAEARLAAHVRPYKLAQTKGARTICPCCAVSCGMMVFSAPNKANGGKLEVTHIEGDVDHPVNRGTLCPKGSAAIDYIRSKS